MERLRLFLARWLVSPLQGVTLGDWLRLLRDNGFRLPPAFWPRALTTTLSALANSWNARRETRNFGAAVGATEVPPPLFILGHYRSGTTHLHNLLGHDPRFAFVNNYQANFPRTFLTTEDVGARLGRAFTMRKRPHDNVELSLSVPTEDELALAADTFLSPHLAWHFPRRAEHYDRRYLTFADASAAERERWIASLRRLARKLTFKYGRPLVFKSPLHTARIPLLLEAFPEARFAHVHRDPERVYLSTLNMERKVEPLFRYQWSRPDALVDKVVWRYAEMYRAYLRDRELIPAGRLVEIGYTELDEQPLETLGTIYSALDLPAFADAAPPIQTYLDSIAGYRKNRYPELEPEVAARLRQEWGFAFQAFGYDTAPAGTVATTSRPTARSR